MESKGSEHQIWTFLPHLGGEHSIWANSPLVRESPPLEVRKTVWSLYNNLPRNSSDSRDIGKRKIKMWNLPPVTAAPMNFNKFCHVLNLANLLKKGAFYKELPPASQSRRSMLRRCNQINFTWSLTRCWFGGGHFTRQFINPPLVHPGPLGSIWLSKVTKGDIHYKSWTWMVSAMLGRDSLTKLPFLGNRREEVVVNCPDFRDHLCLGTYNLFGITF